MGEQWETVNGSDLPGIKGHRHLTESLKVDGGILYRTIITAPSGQVNAAVGVALAFVPATKIPPR